MTIHFYSVPLWALQPPVKGKTPPPLERLDPKIPEAFDALDQALQRTEYRDSFALERAKQLLSEARGPVTYAQPPNDLPALLRTADQLVTLIRQEAGERSRVWRCECGKHYAVPISLMRQVAIVCEHCGRTVELEISTSIGEQSVVDERVSRLNAYRQGLADFFREAMARGWPVLIKDE